MMDATSDLRPSLGRRADESMRTREQTPSPPRISRALGADAGSGDEGISPTPVLPALNGSRTSEAGRRLSRRLAFASEHVEHAGEAEARPSRAPLGGRTTSASSTHTAHAASLALDSTRDAAESVVPMRPPPAVSFASSSTVRRTSDPHASTSRSPSISPPRTGISSAERPGRFESSSSSPPQTSHGSLPSHDAQDAISFEPALLSTANAVPPSAFKYETPMLSREGRVLRSSQTTANGLATATRPPLAPRTAPRSTAKTLRSGQAPKAQRVHVYIDPDEDEAGSNKENKKEDAEEEEHPRVSRKRKGASQEPPLRGDTPAHLSDVDSPGVGRGMPLPSERDRSDSARLLQRQDVQRPDAQDNPFSSSRRRHTPTGTQHPESRSRPDRHRRSPSAHVQADGGSVHSTERSGMNLPGYELGAGEDANDDEADEHLHGHAPAPARSENYPFRRRQPSSQPASDDYAEAVRPASSAGHYRSASAAVPPRKVASIEKMSHEAKLDALRRHAGAAQGRAISQPPLSNGHPGLHGSAYIHHATIEDHVADLSYDSEEHKQRIYEESMWREAAHQRKLPPARIEKWLGGKPLHVPVKDIVKSTTVKGFRFRKVRKAGEGGFSTVWVVRGPFERVEPREEIPEERQAFYAMKQVNLKKLEPQSREEVLKEAEHLEGLARRPGYDEHMLRYFAHRANENHLKILIELGDKDYADVLRDGLPDGWDLAKTFGQMCESVHFLHEAGIIHTDLKPANFLLVDDKIKIIDLGIAQKIPVGTIHISREAMVGTPNYMAPEAVKDIKSRNSDGHRAHIWKAGKASDVWSLGCILYQMVYGRPPFDRLTGRAKLEYIMDEGHQIEYAAHRIRTDPSSPAVDPGLIEIMQQALQYHVDDRATLPHVLRHPSLQVHRLAFKQMVITGDQIRKLMLRTAEVFANGEYRPGEDEAEWVERVFMTLAPLPGHS